MSLQVIPYGSLCSGMEMASQALEPIGYEPAFVAEIEAFPCGVMGYRIGAGRPRNPIDPDTMPTEKLRRQWAANNRELERMAGRGAFGNRIVNEGDFTKIRAANYRHIKLLIGGPPCQDFSIAGKRAGLDGDRGNLTLSYVELVLDLFATGSLRVAAYENVPGLLSDKKNAFGCFLGALVGHDAPIVSPHGQGRWTDAGMVVGPRARAAWRVLDAQHFGLAQRRRRLFVIICPLDGPDPARILFEPEGLFRPASAGSSQGQDIAPTVAGGARRSGGYSLDDVPAVPVAFGGGNCSGPVDVAATLTAKGNRQDWEVETFVAVPFDTTQITSAANRSNPQLGDHCHPVTANGHPPAIAFSIMPMNSGKDFVARVTDVAQPIMAGGPVGGNQGGDYIVQPVAYAPELSPTLKADGFDGSEDGSGRRALVAHAFSVRGRDGEAQIEAEAGDVAPAVRTGTGGSSKSFVATIDGAVRWAVRRLMPPECETLQGSAKDYTRIPWRGKPAEECPDGPRYKIIGNSFPEPIIRWLGVRVRAEFDRVDAESLAA